MIRKMKLKDVFVLFIGFVLLMLQACKSTGSVTETPRKQGAAISANGVLQPQGTTTYQYGSFILIDDTGKTIYALKSEVVQLLNYVGKRVTVEGMLVEGYPIEGGPPYLDVVTVQE
ncbi:MAG TPA: hypothetical protein VFF27_01395 [Bacteroidia bacterium]|jgi:ABC-type Fe3+-hydroxamate transport system substrate-binding protein|nr:hypothetical protein [Bacteroidia bacterium]